MNYNYTLFALCNNNNLSFIKISKTSKNAIALMNEFSISKSPFGYILLKYWSGIEYYSIKTLVLYHRLLATHRYKIKETGKLTEWFDTTLEIIDFVVNEIVAN